MSVTRQQMPPASLFGPSGSHLGPPRAASGLGGLPGGVVGPDAAGLDPSGPEHFFVTLAAYADALDALPLDLTRSFSDLRELDAVLGSHLNSLTARLQHLTALIEDPQIDQGQRLLALKEVAEEARAYKMGGEDKIRVALNTAETIISHTDYIDVLVDQLDRFPEISQLLSPKKHLNLDQYYVRGGGLKNRELIAALDGTLALANAASAAEQGGSKKKKVSANLASGSGASRGNKVLSESMSITGSATGGQPSAAAVLSNSKKRKTNPLSAAAGAGAVSSSKIARTGSSMGKYDEDVKSGTNGISHKKKVVDQSNGSRSQVVNSNTRLPRAAHAAGVYAEDEEDGSARGAARRMGTLTDVDDSSRSRNNRLARTAQRSDDEIDDDGEMDDDDDSPHSTAAKSRARSGRAGGGANTSRGRASGTIASNAGNSPHLGESASASRGDSPASNEGAGGDDADEARYCFCNNVSYGDMIGCDDDDCEREWFHLGCVGLTKPPQGTWYCEACLERRAGNGRSKAKKSKVSSSFSSKNKSRR